MIAVSFTQNDIEHPWLEVTPIHGTCHWGPIRVRLHVMGQLFKRFEVFTSVAAKNAVLWDATTCGCFKNRRFGETPSHVRRGQSLEQLLTALQTSCIRQILDKT
jgi:hypothetical protein